MISFYQYYLEKQSTHLIKSECDMKICKNPGLVIAFAAVIIITRRCGDKVRTPGGLDRRSCGID